MGAALSSPNGGEARGQCEYDVVVVGGGAAGIGAAVGARQANPSARVILVESEGCLGGAITHRNVVAFCGLYTLEKEPRRAIGGVWDDIERKLKNINGIKQKPDRHRGIFQVVEPEALKTVLDQILEENKIEFLLRTTVVGATRVDSSVTAVELQEKGQRRQISAKAFVDCSGDCDLAFHSGASTRYGNHGAVNLGSLASRFGGIPKTANATSAGWRAAIMAAKAKDPSIDSWCRKNGSVLLKLPTSGDVVCFLASASYDGRDSSSITAAEVSGRRQAQKYLEILRGLPGHENMYLVSTGPNFGIRESRHLNSEHCIKHSDILENTPFDDTVALGCWGLEFHDEQQKNWESTFDYPPYKTYGIPLRSLRSTNTKNLFAAGRCVDADQWAASSIRVMGTALATGQAAGIAASLVAIAGHKHGVKTEDVRACLLAHGALLDGSNLPAAPPIAEPDAP